MIKLEYWDLGIVLEVYSSPRDLYLSLIVIPKKLEEGIKNYELIRPITYGIGKFE